MRRTRFFGCVSAMWIAMVASAQTISLEAMILQFTEDEGSLRRTYPIEQSAERVARFKAFYESKRKELDRLDVRTLGVQDAVDVALLHNTIGRELRTLAIDDAQRAEIMPLIPFVTDLVELELARRRMEPLDPAKTAQKLNDWLATVRNARQDVEAALGRIKDRQPPKALAALLKNPADARTRALGLRAAKELAAVDRHLDAWYRFYFGYDPMFSWWCDKPYKALDEALKSYQDFLKEAVVGIRPDDTTTIIGYPIGAEALKAELEFERIPYTPEELFDIAQKEFAWCDAEMLKASRALGYGDDWKKALEHVKNQYVAPGDQPKLIRELALEAIAFLEARDLVTIPELAKETWRMEMLSPQQQLVSPFFLGGEVIQVSFPTAEMAHEAKMMSLRGNNRFFARATVQHELIPGHHLQGFMLDRYRPYRSRFYTPFWMEGWALYWEMRLWDLGFPKTPEEKIGMLFWRMHRCARIIFSLGFHLGRMTPQECVDFLVERVGHERENAAAEVRRSFAGDYPPLYQAAYMLGGLQIRALHRQFVGSKKMTERAFHDTILQNGSIPIESVRAILANEKPDPKSPPTWRFYDGPKPRVQ